jgi:hypothetical protein
VLVTFAQFAKEQGVSGPAISQAAKKRLLRAVRRDVKGRPMLDLEVARDLWGKGNVRQARETRPAADEQTGRKRPVTAAVAAEVMKLADDAIPEIGISLERKEHYRAELAKVEAMQRRAELGSVAEMKHEAFALGKAVREGVLGVIPRLSADLAAMADRFEIEQRLDEELTTALRVLADG